MALLITGVVLTLGYLVAIFGVLLGYSLLTARRRKPPPGARVILVLGAPLYNGRVMPLLASRLDAALNIYAESAAPEAVVVVSGGRPTSSSPGTEAAAMADYLVDRGVPRERVLLEEASTTTRENIRFSKELEILTDLGSGVGPGAQPVVVTSDFHVLRTASICRRCRLRAGVFGAISPSGSLRRSILREYGLLLGQLWPLHIVAAVVVAAVLIAVAAQ